VYIAESTELQGQAVYTLRVHPDAQVDVDWKLTWKNAECLCFELGVKMMVPHGADSLRWSRETLWTDYPAGHIGAPEGTAVRGDLSFGCTKRDIRWASLSGKQPFGLTVLEGGSPLHIRTGQEAGNTQFFLSSTVAPPVCFSTGLAREYQGVLKKDQTVSGAFKLRLTSATQP